MPRNQGLVIGRLSKNAVRVHAALRRERHGGDDGGAVVRDVDMLTAPGADDGAGEERPVPPSGEARADHDERRAAMT